MKRVFCLALCLSVGLVVLPLSSCSTMGGRMKHFVRDEKEHKAEITRVVGDFHQALYWGDAELASAFVNPDIRDDFFLQTSRRKEKERVLEANIQQIKLGSSQDMATVSVAIKFYNIPNYDVKTRHEKQTWEFNSDEGRWVFKDSQVEGVS